MDTKCWVWYAECPINETVARGFWDAVDKKHWVARRRLQDIIRRNAKFPLSHDDRWRFNLSIPVESYNVTKPRKPYPASLSLDRGNGILNLQYEDERGVSLPTLYSSA